MAKKNQKTLRQVKEVRLSTLHLSSRARDKCKGEDSNQVPKDDKVKVSLRFRVEEENVITTS